MKKKFALALALALTLSLTACNKPAAEPAASSSDQSVTEPTVEQTVHTEPTTETISTEAPDSAEIEIISDSTMLRFFESAFEGGKLVREITKNQDTLQIELEDLATFQTDTYKFKEGYQDEYVIWRANKLASAEELPEISSDVEDVSKGDVEDKAPSSGANGQTTEKAPEKAPSGGNTSGFGDSDGNNSSNVSNNSGASNSSGNPFTNTYKPSENPDRLGGLTDEQVDEHIKNSGVTFGGSGD